MPWLRSVSRNDLSHVCARALVTPRRSYSCHGSARVVYLRECPLPFTGKPVRKSSRRSTRFCHVARKRPKSISPSRYRRTCTGRAVSRRSDLDFDASVVLVLTPIGPASLTSLLCRKSKLDILVVLGS